MRRSVAVLLVGVLGCGESTAPPTQGRLSLILATGSGLSLDSGHVVVSGPTTKTVPGVTLGSTVTVDSLAPGTYTVGFEGFSGGGVAYFAQLANVSVAVGKTTTATIASFPSFHTTILVMPAYTVTGQFTVVYANAAGASGFVVQRDTLASFATPHDTTVAAGDTSVALTIPLRAYHVRVRALDAYGTVSAPSAPQAIAAIAAMTVTPATATIAPGATQQFTATATDATGATVTGVTFFWSSSNQAAATINQSGLATGVAGGTTSISGLGLGVPGSATLTVTGGVPEALVFAVQPPASTTAGAVLSPVVQVEIRDANNTLVPTARNPVTLALTGGPAGATLVGGTTVNAVGGVASFSSLSIPEAGTGYALVATSSGLTGVTSSAFTITPGTATKLAFTVAPSTAAVGVAISPAVQVAIQDALGNTVTSATTTITLALGTNPGGGSLSGTTAVAAVSGVATFSTLSITAAVGAGYTLAATATGLAGATSAAFTITVGAPSKLVFSVAPTNAVAATALIPKVLPAVQVTVQDAGGNPVTSATTPITLAIGTNPGGGTLSGTTTVAAVSGVATFSTLSINAPGTGYTLTASATGLTSATSSAFNLASQPLLYVANQFGGPSNVGSITVYAAGASGNATPTATITGSYTGLGYPVAIARDGAGKIYVANEFLPNTGNGSIGSITVYAAGAAGNAGPTATIAGSNTGLYVPTGIALDGAGNLYVANQDSNNILVYAPGASGNATPVATIAGGNTGLAGPAGIALDGAGNIYVANLFGNSITVYAAGASGNVAPTYTLAGGNTGLFLFTRGGPPGIALDAAGNLYVANTGGNNILVFAAGASGNVFPTATIAGSNTGLLGLVGLGIALDAAGNIYVAQGINNILVFAAGASGNVAPTATIAGSNTGLGSPSAIAF